LVTFQDADEILLKARSGRGVSQRAVLAILDDLICGFPNADEADGHDRVSRKRTTGGVDLGGSVKTQRFTKNQLLETERCMELSNIDRALTYTRRLGGKAC
jgi:hypothetical protein